MLHRYISFRRRIILTALITLFFFGAQPKSIGQSSAPGLDIFSGLDFNFRDINYITQYELLVRVTPGFKWDMGNHWQLAGQVYIPVINQFDEEFDYIQPNIFNLSKEFCLKNLYLKTSAGLFSMNRYGLDVKAFLPIREWFAFEGQLGYTGFMLIRPYWEISPPNRFSCLLGGDIYLSQWNTQVRCVGGRYLYRDYGGEVEIMRHFNHTSVSLYGRWNNYEGLDAGFRVIIAIPPYHRKHRAVNIRPASNFRMAYAVMYHPYTNKMYRTDPEENERDGWFSRDLLHWGSHTMQPDFIITELRKKE